jgi:TolB-like protein
MQPSSLTFPEIKFSKEVIYEQLQKIFRDPFFSKSDILRRFLLFIVDQTLSGHENWLKEYTIATSVLNKSSNFKPQENGIVRIHAGRLRRALHNYYNSSGVFDAVLISIPKGCYVPVFEAKNYEKDIINNTDKISVNDGYATSAKRPAAIAVIPFRHLAKNPLETFLADGLGSQLSTALMPYEKFSVIAYYTIRNLCEKTTDLATLASVTGVQYVITGDIQSLENRIRIRGQMIDTRTNEQLSSWMHEGKFSAENIFELQDEFVKLIITEFNSGKYTNQKKQAVHVMAVA